MQTRSNLIRQRPLRGFPQNSFPLTIRPQHHVVPVSWHLLQHADAPMQSAPQQDGMAFGTFLACLATALGGAVLLDPKTSRAAKEIAKTTLGVSIPFLLNKAFDLQAWPGQSLN